MSDYEQWTVAQLKEELKQAGLPVSGKKVELIARLVEVDPEPTLTEDIAPPENDGASTDTLQDGESIDATKKSKEQTGEIQTETDEYDSDHDVESTKDIDANGEIEEKELPFEPAESKSEGNVEFLNLPSRATVIGGDYKKQSIPAFMLAFLLIFSFGMYDRYDELYGFETSFSEDVKTGDCIVVTNTYGSGWHELYEPYHEKNVDCTAHLSEIFEYTLDPNFWQLERDAEAQAILDALAESAEGEGNHSGYVWTSDGIAQMSIYANVFGQNMSTYGDPIAGDEFSSVHLGIWNGFGNSNDSFEDLLPGGVSIFNIPQGMIAVKPTGYIWTEEGIAQMTIYSSFFALNMSVFSDPVPGDVFTEQHLGIWNGFGNTNDSFENLSEGGSSPLNIPSGLIGHAPTGYLWSHAGVATASYYAEFVFMVNMSVYADPVPGDIFRQKDLDLWNGFGSTVGGGNDTFDSLLPEGTSPFKGAGGIVLTVAEWANQTPMVSNVSILTNTSISPHTHNCDYVFSDNQGDNDTSLVEWYVDATLVANGSSYQADVPAGSTLVCSVTPNDGLYTGEKKDSNIESEA